MQHNFCVPGATLSILCRSIINFYQSKINLSFILINVKSKGYVLILEFVQYLAIGFYAVGFRFVIYALVAAYAGTYGIHLNRLRNLTKHHFEDPTHPTYSYHGWENRIMFNLMHHNEHHDFPKCPSRYLPLVSSTDDSRIDLVF